MNINAVAKRYNRLTPEEHSRLILAASGRSEEAECRRLVKAEAGSLYKRDQTD